MGINLGSLTPEPTTDIKAQVAPAAPVAEPTPAPAPAPAPVIELPVGVEKVDRGGGIVSLNLQKGISLDLTKTLPSLNNIHVGLGWDPAQGVSMDLDVVAVALHNGKVLSGNDIAFYNQRTIIPGVTISEDNRTGQGEGDDESIEMVLSSIPADVTEVAIFVTIHEGAQKNQNFGMVHGAYVRIVDNNTKKEEAIHVLNEGDAALYETFHFATFKRNGAGWSFDTVDKGMHGDVMAIANSFN